MKYPDDFTVVWSGCEPLLPPRRSKPPRWWTMGAGHALVEQDPKEAARMRESIRPKRAYHRKNNGRVSPVQPGPADSTGQPDTPGAGATGHSTEPVSLDPTTQTNPATE